MMVCLKDERWVDMTVPLTVGNLAGQKAVQRVAPSAVPLAELWEP
jgi:hypothetical protein